MAQGSCPEAALLQASPSAVNRVCTQTYKHTHTHAHAQLTPSAMCAVFQGHQQSSWPEAGGRDPHVVAQAHRQHRGHLLRLLHHIRDLGSAGERARHTDTQPQPCPTILCCAVLSKSHQVQTQQLKPLHPYVAYLLAMGNCMTHSPTTNQ